LNKRGPWHNAGALFSWVVVALAVIAQFAGVSFAICLGLVFFVLGLSHGAGDEQDDTLASFTLVHAAAYVVIGAAVAGLFLVEPLGGLALFFALSAWHFSRSDCRFDQTTRIAIAGLAIGGSALFRANETAAVLSFVTGEDLPTNFLRFLALAGIVGAGFALYAFINGRRGFGHAVVAGLSTAFLQPVLAVGLIFLIAHALPVQERQIATYGRKRVLRAVALPTAIATFGAAAVAIAVAVGALPTQVAVALAFGMATPHMLTERLER